MVLYFSGTGNSKYIAKRIAEAIRENTVDLNMKIKENDTSPLQTGRDVIICLLYTSFRKVKRGKRNRINGMMTVDPFCMHFKKFSIKWGSLTEF